MVGKGKFVQMAKQSNLRSCGPPFVPAAESLHSARCVSPVRQASVVVCLSLLASVSAAVLTKHLQGHDTATGQEIEP